MQDAKKITLLLIGLFPSIALASDYSVLFSKELTRYPAGFSVGGSLGNGYLSAHENNNLNDTILGPTATPPYQSKSFQNGQFIWSAYGAYDFLTFHHLVTGIAIGYQSLGQSHGSAYYSSMVNTSPFITNTLTYQYQYQQKAVNFLLTGRLYVTEKLKGLNFIGKVGAAYVKATDTIQFQGRATQTVPLTILTKNYSDSPSIWRIEPEFDLGVGYSLSQHLDIHILYTYIGGTDGNTSTNASNTNGFNAPWQGVFAFNAVSGGLSYSFG